MFDSEDTIVAIASPTSPSSRGAVRLSGPQVVSILTAIGVSITDTKSAHCVDVSIDVGDPLGKVAVRVLVWPTSRSYTGQPSAELHTYGSLPILQALVDTTTRGGARPARPGEFTMRAFLAGRLDLTQAEAVLGVIDAQHRGSLDHALRQLSGNLSRPLEELRSTLLDLLADVEAGLDFVDEDIEFVSDETLVLRLSEIAQQLVETQRVMMSRDGASARIVIALLGEPNAGKSRLLNRLVDQEAAIVADIAGTTRDTVAVNATLQGRPVAYVDTAGIEERLGDTSDDAISKMSQQQARRVSQDANLRLWCVDTTRADLSDACLELRSIANEQRRQSTIDLWVGTKSDLADSQPLSPDWIATSSLLGSGVERLKESMASAISCVDAEEVGSVVGTAARCRDTLTNAVNAIEAAISLTQTQSGHEFISAEIRTAVQALGEVTGAVYTDDILDRVFGRFCIGK